MTFSLSATTFIFLFISFARQCHASPRDMRPRKDKRKQSCSWSSTGLPQHKESSALGSALCASLGVRAPLTRECRKEKCKQKGHRNQNRHPSGWNTGFNLRPWGLHLLPSPMPPIHPSSRHRLHPRPSRPPSPAPLPTAPGTSRVDAPIWGWPEVL
jgi:hypothetical protein